MNKQEAEQFKVAVEAAHKASDIDIQEDFGGIQGWDIRSDREGYYLTHERCGELLIHSVMVTPPRLVRLMKQHDASCVTP